ncbi:hypothetical protein [Paenibacillus alvei]|nr:hypothetical protein [Paenibacillus alvei]
MTFFSSLLTVLDTVEKAVGIVAGVTVIYQSFQAENNKQKSLRD